MSHLEHSLKDMLPAVMESTQDRNIRIATEGLRLVTECKVPRFCSSAGFDQMVQQQREWAKRLPDTMPPLLDWMEQHRQALFGEERPPAAVEDFQKRFVLFFLEQQSGFLKHGEFQLNSANHRDLEHRLSKFNDDVWRILGTNTAIRRWLFHYYGSELGLQGWQCRPGDVYNLYYLFQFLDRHKMGDRFGQKMLSFVECIGKEMMGFPQNMEYQGMGILLIATLMDINHEKKVHTKDAEEILNIALHLNTIGEMKMDFGDDLWLIIYYSVASFRVADCALGDEVMLPLLAYLNDEIVKREDNPNVSFGSGQLAYLRAITLLLMLDVPDVDVNYEDHDFDELTLSGATCDRATFRRHAKFHLQMADKLRFSTNMRLRIARMIPKLFAGFTSTANVNTSAYKCLELLAWLTMFPVGPTRQQKNAMAIMLTRLMMEIRGRCEGYIKNPSDYSYGEDDLHELNAHLHPLLSVVREGIKQLPNERCFRRFKSEMQMCITAVYFVVEILKCFKVQVVEEEDL